MKMTFKDIRHTGHTQVISSDKKDKKGKKPVAISHYL